MNICLSPFDVRNLACLTHVLLPFSPAQLSTMKNRELQETAKLKIDPFRP